MRGSRLLNMTEHNIIICACAEPNVLLFYKQYLTLNDVHNSDFYCNIDSDDVIEQ